MKRLTRKIKGADNYCEFELKDQPYKSFLDIKRNSDLEWLDVCDLTLAIDKLGQLEDLEKELGIDSITLFKAINSKSIFTKYDGKIVEHIEDNYNERDWYMQDKIVYFYWEDGSHVCFEFKDYDKNWSLNRWKLENE